MGFPNAAPGPSAGAASSVAADSRHAVTTGNAVTDGERGWFVGQFVPPEGGLRRRDDFEMKWGVHRKGERKTGSWAVNAVSTTLTILIDGEGFNLRFRVAGVEREARLRKRGDYVIWDAGVAHTWHAPSDCIVLTVRCPSVAADQVASGETTAAQSGARPPD